MLNKYLYVWITFAADYKNVFKIMFLFVDFTKRACFIFRKEMPEDEER